MSVQNDMINQPAYAHIRQLKNELYVLVAERTRLAECHDLAWQIYKEYEMNRLQYIAVLDDGTLSPDLESRKLHQDKQEAQWQLDACCAAIQEVSRAIETALGSGEWHGERYETMVDMSLMQMAGDAARSRRRRMPRAIRGQEVEATTQHQET